MLLLIDLALFQHYSVLTTVQAVHLVVILIWQFGGFSSNRQIKITANTVVLSQVLTMNELICQTKCLPICFSSQTAKLNVRQMYHSYGMFYCSTAESV